MGEERLDRNDGLQSTGQEERWERMHSGLVDAGKKR